MEVKKRIASDIVIIGGGNAGLIAAIEARNRGAGVLLIEKGPKARRGGNSRVSGGHFRIACEKGTEDFPFLLEGASLPQGRDRDSTLHQAAVLCRLDARHRRPDRAELG